MTSHWYKVDWYTVSLEAVQLWSMLVLSSSLKNFMEVVFLYKLLASYPGLSMFFNVCTRNTWEGLGTRLQIIYVVAIIDSDQSHHVRTWLW